jgi:hypothetical protein
MAGWADAGEGRTGVISYPPIDPDPLRRSQQSRQTHSPPNPPNPPNPSNPSNPPNPSRRYPIAANPRAMAWRLSSTMPFRFRVWTMVASTSASLNMPVWAR